MRFPKLPRNKSNRLVWLVAGYLTVCSTVQADYKLDVGYTALVARLGAATPTGAGVVVSQIEAPYQAFNDYLPSAADPDFAGKTITDISGFGVGGLHATIVGRFFFGNAGIAKGVTQVRSYEVESWFSNQMRLGTTQAPAVETALVQNHSYAGYFNSPTDPLNVEALRRIDLAIDRDGFTCVVGAGNGHVSHFNVPINAQLTNGITVGLTNGNSTFHLTNIDGPGRVKPDLVAPENYTSNSTPMVAASAALLHQVAGNRAAAHRPEVIKAVLMAGATKKEFPSWTRLGNEPLDRSYGAGELNINNSYNIMTAGESNPFDRLRPAHTALGGWDYEKIRAGGKNYYFFDTHKMANFGEWSIIAAWDRHIAFNLGTLTPSMANIDLKFYRADENFRTLSLMQQSVSAVDNVEHIYFKELPFGWYALEVSSNLSWDYGLAWLYTANPRIGPVPEPTGLLVVTLLAVVLGWRVFGKRFGMIPIR